MKNVLDQDEQELATCIGTIPSGEFLTRVIAEYRREYDYSIDNWRHLDSKSQVCVTLSGVLLSATFVFVKQLLDSKTPGTVARINVFHELTIALLLLLGALVVAVVALFIRGIPRPPIGSTILESVCEAARDIGSREGAVVLTEDLDRQQLLRWVRCNLNIARTTWYKGLCVRAAQFLLFLSMLDIGIMTLILVEL